MIVHPSTPFWHRTMSIHNQIQNQIEEKIADNLAALHLEVINESGQHNVAPGSETHFKVVVVSPDFEGKNLVQRHRLIYALVDEEIKGGVHALSLHTYTEDDWRARNGEAPMSPPCLGGKAREH